MVAPLYLNVKEAREHFLKQKTLYTLREERKTTGITEVRAGSYYKYEVLGKIRIGLAARFGSLDPSNPILKLYVAQSGFHTVEAWLEAAHALKGGKNEPNCLYRVEMVD